MQPSNQAPTCRHVGIIWIDSLEESKLFTVLDALLEYFQVAINDGRRVNTTITSHIGTYHYTHVPSALQNAPATFQRALDITLFEARRKISFVYVDDFVFFTSNKQ